MTTFRDGLTKTAKFAKLTIFHDDLAKTTKCTKLTIFCDELARNGAAYFTILTATAEFTNFTIFRQSLLRFSQLVPLCYVNSNTSSKRRCGFNNFNCSLFIIRHLFVLPSYFFTHNPQRYLYG